MYQRTKEDDYDLDPPLTKKASTFNPYPHVRHMGETQGIKC